MGVGYHQAHPGEPAGSQRAQEALPEPLALAVADVASQDLAVAVGGDAGGHDHRHRDDLGDAVAHLEVGRVHIDVGELDVIEAPSPERLDHLVEPRADARHLRLRYPRLRAQRGHQIIHRAGGHPGDVGLHDDRVQGPVDAPARLEHRRQQRALAQLGDPQLDVAGLGGQQPRPVPVALIHTSVAALIAPRADRLGGLGLDQLLEHQAHRAAHQLRAATGAKRHSCAVSVSERVIGVSSSMSR